MACTKKTPWHFFSALYFKNSRPDWFGDLGKMKSDRKTREMVVYFAKCCWTSIQHYPQIVTYFRYSSDLPVRQACRSLQTRGNSPPWKPYKEKSWEAATPAWYRSTQRRNCFSFVSCKVHFGMLRTTKSHTASNKTNFDLKTNYNKTYPWVRAFYENVWRIWKRSRVRDSAFPIFYCNLPEFTQVFGGGRWCFWCAGF